MCESPTAVFNKEKVLKRLVRLIDRSLWRVKTVLFKCWWNLVPGTVISIPWPSGPNYKSTDPNECFREWLTEQVGRQRWDWDWDLGDVSAYDGRGELLVKFRWGYEKQALIFALKWGLP
jgi:hypothetical protein